MSSTLFLAVSLCIIGVYVAQASPRCPAGHASPTGEAPCHRCNAGWFTPGEGYLVCTPCQAGHRAPEPGATECLKCEAGKYNAQTARASCTKCERGRYQFLEGQTNCLPCPAGRYQNNPGKTECKPCPRGQWSGAGATSCNRCPAGQTTRAAGASALSLCVDIDSIDDDPHILITSSGHNLCFNVHGQDEQVYDLISDDDNEIYVTGKTFEIEIPGRPNVFSYFKAVGIHTAEHMLQFNRESYTVDGKKYSYSEEIDMDDLTVVAAGMPDSYQVELHNGAVFMVTRKSHDKVGVYMGVHALGNDGLSESSSGIIGQFLYSKFKPMIEDEESSATMVFDDDHDAVPVHKTTRHSSVTGKTVDCWMYYGKPDMLLGDHDHYLVDQL